MPSFKGSLTDQQIADVAAYVLSVAGQRHRPAPSPARLFLDSARDRSQGPLERIPTCGAPRSRRRAAQTDFDRTLVADERWRALIPEVDDLRSRTKLKGKPSPGELEALQQVKVELRRRAPPRPA